MPVQTQSFSHLDIGGTRECAPRVHALCILDGDFENGNNTSKRNEGRL